MLQLFHNFSRYCIVCNICILFRDGNVIETLVKVSVPTVQLLNKLY